VPTELELTHWRREVNALYGAVSFLYHRSCRHDEAGHCPLAQPGNTIAVPVQAGERL
jgi:hypothetical protein